MLIDRRLFMLLSFVLLWSTGSGDSCPYTPCTCMGPEILCGDFGDLSALPVLANRNYSNFTTFYLGMTKIASIPTGSLTPLLTEITFINIPLTNIDDTALDESASTLVQLQITNTLLTRIPDALSHLRALKLFIVSKCNIEDWNAHAMTTICATLEMLDLSYVGLSAWPDWIKFCSNLIRLRLVDGFLAFIPDGAMDNLANNLQYLFLTNNSLTSVPRAIAHFASLQQVDLSFNKISDVSWLPQLSQIFLLALNNNNISDATALSNALLHYAHVLKSVDLQENSLTIIPNLDFLTNVNSLDLTKNKLSDPNSGSVPPGLISINLGYNLLPYVPRFMSKLQSITDLVLPFNSILKIEDVDYPPYISSVELGYNLITELTDTSFPYNSSISLLHLNNNPISLVSHLAFKNLPVLTELSLSGSRLARMPLGLAFLPKLSMLNMNDMGHLVCTCEEKSLESWVVSMLDYNVEGVCGHTSIYFFFQTLSPSCPEQ